MGSSSLGRTLKIGHGHEQLVLVNLALAKGARLDDLQWHFSISPIVLRIWVLMFDITMSVLGSQLKSRKHRAAGWTEASMWKKTSQDLYFSYRSFLELILMCLNSISWLFAFPNFMKNCQSQKSLIFW